MNNINSKKKQQHHRDGHNVAYDDFESEVRFLAKGNRIGQNKKDYTLHYLCGQEEIVAKKPSRNVMCPIFLTLDEERQFDRVAAKSATNTKRLVIEKW